MCRQFPVQKIPLNSNIMFFEDTKFLFLRILNFENCLVTI
ncbi:hypothetical protein D1BOALGB6SA_2796 [Olavius sp. associated proteobacterium Delta 1]|nr:hypothetical protein D1BOALGB6SA_2796 [Olavius sp. associated proteobacterium Delta 1]